MMRQLMLTAKRTVTPAQAKGRITDPLDEGGAIRERLPVGKGYFECFCETGRCGHVFDLLMRRT
jgi:hypothetical protein